MTLYSSALKKMERELFPKVLAACGWNRSEACRRLGISRGTLATKLKRLRIRKPGKALGHKIQSLTKVSL